MVWKLRDFVTDSYLIMQYLCIWKPLGTMKNNMKINRRDFFKSSVLAGLPQADIDLLVRRNPARLLGIDWQGLEA